MKILHPDNFYFNTLFKSLNKTEIQSRSESMLISKRLKGGKAEAAFVPVMDLLTNSEFFVSKKICLGFDGGLSDAFIFYRNKEDDFNTFNLFGDISTTESLLIKFLMKENYEKEVKLQILDPMKHSAEEFAEDRNVLAAGDINFEKDNFMSGISLSDEIIETFEIPYINHLLVSNSEDNLKAAEEHFERAEEIFFSYIDEKKWENPFTKNFEKYFEENYSRLILELTPEDIDAALSLIRLPYFHGLVEEISEIKFV